jgi:hypothetical protein
MIRGNPLRCRLVVALLCAALVFASAAAPARAATPEQIQASINKAKAWLYSIQNAQGNWELTQTREPTKIDNDVRGTQWGGRTAMTVYALLAAGEKHDDPRLAKGIDFLKKAEITGTYAIAMRMLAFSFLPQTDEVKKLIARDGNFLLTQIKTTANAAGHFDYGPGRNTPGGYSHSRSQYGALGLWVAEQAGFEVPNKAWQAIEAGWVRNQDKTGGWRYKHPSDPTPHDPTPGMTAAAVASLFITADSLHASRGLDCKSDSGNIPALDKGLAWLAKNMNLVATDQEYDRDFPLITLYAVERIGVAGGLKYIGDVDWYAKGSDWLVKGQLSTGTWGGTGVGGMFDAHVQTCFAVIFLSRGRAPVVINKLQYAAPGRTAKDKPDETAWNNRPRDAANAVRWMARNLERDLNWQVVNLSRPVRELHDAPILYVAGNAPPTFTDEEKAKLRQYIEEGGLIVGHADCRDDKFVKAMLKLGGELFPQYEFRELPENHPIYVDQNFKRTNWRRKPGVQGMTNGTRELMLVLRDDPGRAWQQQNPKEPSDFELPTNIYLYAIDKQNALFKGQSYLVDVDPKVSPTRTVKLARLEYGGDWNPEPAGWRQLAAVLNNRFKTKLDVAQVKLGTGKLGEYRVAHLTGTREFKFTAAERDELKAFVAAGGTLLVDAAGGSGVFAVAVENELRSIWPDAKLEALPRDHALYAAGGAKLTEFGWRNYARTKVGGLSGPRIKALTVNNRPAVIYSPDDLSTGWMAAPFDGIVGYDPKTATEIGVRMVLFAADAK